MLLAGVAKHVITPPLGRRLAGYPQRQNVSTHVHDELFVRAVVLAQDGDRHVVVSADVMAVESSWVDRVRGSVEASLGIPADNVLVATTHTHSAHGGLFTFSGRYGQLLRAMFADSVGELDSEAYDTTLRQTVTAIERAATSLQPVTLGTAEVDVPGISSNRFWESAPADASCRSVSLTGLAGDVQAVLFHFACHPTVMGHEDTGVSGDFPGLAAEVVERHFGAGVVALPLNGALGDVSTRFTRRSQRYEEAQRFAQILAGGVIEGVETQVKLEPVVTSRVATAVVPAKGHQWAADAEERVADLRERIAEIRREAGYSHGRERQLVTALQGAQIGADLAPHLLGLDGIDVEMQRLRLSADFDLVGVPIEMFSGLEDRIRAAVPGRVVRVVGPANGYLGYVPTAEAFEQGGYEADTSLVAPGGGEVLADAVIGLLAD